MVYLNVLHVIRLEVSYTKLKVQRDFEHSTVLYICQFSE